MMCFDEIFCKISKKRKKIIQNDYSFSDIFIVVIRKVFSENVFIYLFILSQKCKSVILLVFFFLISLQFFAL